MKKVSEILKENNVERCSLLVFNTSGFLVGTIKDSHFENDMALHLTQMKVRDNEFSIRNNEAIISIHEQDNMPYIKLMYRIIAEWKYLIWEENGL